MKILGHINWKLYLQEEENLQNNTQSYLKSSNGTNIDTQIVVKQRYNLAHVNWRCKLDCSNQETKWRSGLLEI